MAQTLTCPKCKWPAPETAISSEQLQPCPNCSVPLRIELFPAFFKPAEAGRTGEAILVDGEASCFYHPQKRAAVPCASCGRFLCALCDLEVNGQHICPVCLEAGQKKGKLAELQNKRILWDSSALALAVVPIVFWPLTLLTAPAAIVVGIYGWNKPSSIVGRTRLRIYLAILIGLLQLGGWVTVFVLMFKGRLG